MRKAGTFLKTYFRKHSNITTVHAPCFLQIKLWVLSYLGFPFQLASIPGFHVTHNPEGEACKHVGLHTWYITHISVYEVYNKQDKTTYPLRRLSKWSCFSRQLAVLQCKHLSSYSSMEGSHTHEVFPKPQRFFAEYASHVFERKKNGSDIRPNCYPPAGG